MLRSTRRAGGGGWASAVVIAAADGSGHPWAGPNPQLGVRHGRQCDRELAQPGRADDLPNRTDRLQTACGPAPGCGSRGAPAELVSGGELWAAELGVDPVGYVTALWTSRARATSALASSTRSRRHLGEVSVPASGVVGQSVAVSANPLDVWSPGVRR